MAYVCFDIGGTKTRVGVSHDGETFVASQSFNTPTTAPEGIKGIVATARELGAESVQAICGGVRGVLTEARDGIATDATLPKWVGQSLTAPLSEALDGAGVTLENDTALAGLGEAVFGAGEGLDIVAYHTISTGVGGVRITRGAIDAASVGFEPGHQILDLDRSVLGDSVSPTLENLVAGGAVESRMNCKPYEIPQSDVIWDELARYLAAGLRNTTLYWSPDIIILGGSMIIGDPRIELDAIRHHTVESLDGFVDCPYIAHAKLGDASALYGALVLVRAQEGS